MKNIEKYFDELIKCDEGDNDDNACCYWRIEIKKDENCGDWSCDQCRKEFLKWLNKEYKEPIRPTDNEKEILKIIGNDYKYIARDRNGKLCVYVEKPYRDRYLWMSESLYCNIDVFNHLFQFIKWEDEEPYSIEKLLKEEQK